MKKDRQRAPMGVQLPQLRAWRLYKLMSMRALSEASGVSPNTINNVETQQGYARFETVGKLARGLGITPEALVYEQPPATPGSEEKEGRAVA
jgi:transcriptional regulator with XRE-family HTH domain